MALTQCAIFYWTNTGALALKLLLDDDSQYASITAPTNRSFFLTPLVQNPKQAGCPDDDTCRQLIANKRGLPVVPEQFTAQIDAAGNVVAVHRDTDPSVSPAEVGAPKGHALAAAPNAVMNGDTFATGVFSRRWVVADAVTGLVASVSIVPVTAQGTTSPTAIPLGSFTVPSNTLQVGQIAPLPKTVAAVPLPTV